MHENRDLLSRWLLFGMAVLLLSGSTASAAPILAFHHRESGFVLRTHERTNLAACMGMVRQQLDRLEWETFPPEQQEPGEQYGVGQYSVEPGTLWNDEPLLPPVQLQRVEK